MKAQCIGCQDKIQAIDYKDTALLRKFVSSQFKIKSSYTSQLCPKHQRMMANAVKLARYMALMPYTRNQVRQK